MKNLKLLFFLLILIYFDLSTLAQQPESKNVIFTCTEVQQYRNLEVYKLALHNNNPNTYHVQGFGAIPAYSTISYLTYNPNVVVYSPENGEVVSNFYCGAFGDLEIIEIDTDFPKSEDFPEHSNHFSIHYDSTFAPKLNNLLNEMEFQYFPKEDKAKSIIITRYVHLNKLINQTLPLKLICKLAFKINFQRINNNWEIELFHVVKEKKPGSSNYRDLETIVLRHLVDDFVKDFQTKIQNLSK